LVCDGEIYNYDDLKIDLEKSGHHFNTNLNSEVIVHSYEQWGVECFDRLRGVFSICIYDKSKELLILARDHLGIKTLYYYSDGDKFIFGSEIKAILCYDIKRELDLNSFSIYLSLGYVSTNNTLIKNIKKIPPSSFLIFDLNEKDEKIQNYWNIVFNKKKKKNEHQIAKELKLLILESINIRIKDQIPVGAFLSGGIDSSAVVGALRNLIDGPINTYSVSFDEGAPVNESKFAKIVADYNDTNHKEIYLKSNFYDKLPKLIWHNDDLFSDAAIIPVYFLSKAAAKDVNYVFTGDGADEVFAGYSQRYRAQTFNFFKFIPSNLISMGMKFYKFIPYSRIRISLAYIEQSKSIEDIYIRNLFDGMSDKEKERVLPFKSVNVKELIESSFENELDIIHQLTRWDLKYQLPNLYNVKADRAISAASLTGRIPLLDKKIVSWSLSVPSNLKLKNSIEKYILRKAIKDFVPPQILKRRKLGFGTPVNFWLKTVLKEISEQYLENLRKRKFLIAPEYVKTIIKKRHKKLYEFRAWNLLMFELWYETYIEGNGTKPIQI
jgi:asparagine synthase (glutamine-hydrolysing)